MSAGNREGRPASPSIPERLREQAGWCGQLGSPLYATLLARAAADFEAGGPCREVLAGHEGDPGGSMLALRLLGAVHRLVLSGRAPELARFYPSAGGDASRPGAWEAFRGTVEREAGELRQLVEQPVQTNEVGRSAALLGGFLEVAAAAGLPLRLLELGASAGLNLRWDRFHYRAEGWSWGDPGSPVRLDFAGAGRPRLEARAEVASRRGCDPRPVDPASEEGRLTLLSYVWADQERRLANLTGAIALAREVPAEVEQADAAEWLPGALADPVPGAATVVFHSIVMQYLPREGRQRVRELLAEAGARASREAPLAWLRMEPGGREAEVRLTLWPGGEERLLAEAGYHGREVRWLVPPAGTAQSR